MDRRATEVPTTSLRREPRVELSVAAGSSRRADVYDREGRLAHIVEWPADIDLFANGAIRGSIAHGVIRDSLDVQRVVRLRLR